MLFQTEKRGLRLMARIMDYFTAEGMLRDEKETGCLPSTKEAYINNLRLAWPSAVEGLGLSMATMADTAMVGSLGAEAIAAVGIPRLPIFMVTAVIRSLNIGLTATLSRKYGAGDKKGVVCCFKQGFLISFILGILMLLFVESLSRHIVVFAGAGSDIADLAEEYYKIICVGNFFNCISLSINAAQIGTGNTKISMMTNITANAVNLIMNYFLYLRQGAVSHAGYKGRGYCY